MPASPSSDSAQLRVVQSELDFILSATAPTGHFDRRDGAFCRHGAEKSLIDFGAKD
jgi:hypothetical protein